MNRKEPLASNPSPNTREGDSQKAEETSRAAEISRAVGEARAASVEARRKWAEQERIASDDSGRTEELRQVAREIHSAAENLRTAAEEAKEVLEKVKQPQKNSEGMDFTRTPEDETGGGKLFQIQMEQMPGYLAARLTGVAQPGEGSRQFKSIAEHCKHTNNDKLLYDVTKYKVMNPHLVDKFILAERAEIFGFSLAFGANKFFASLLGIYIVFLGPSCLVAETGNKALISGVIANSPISSSLSTHSQ